MKATGWKGATFGIRIGEENAAVYFHKDWKSVQIELDGQAISFRIAAGFWRDCPEIRGKEIGLWFGKHNLAPWPKGHPPKLELVPLDGSKFRLQLGGSD